MLFNKEPGFRLYCLFLLVLYLTTGMYGLFWISDEFDQERATFYAFFGVPFTLLFFAQIWYRKEWWLKNPVTFWSSVLVVVLTFSWGNLLWLNGISGSDRSVVNVTIRGAAYEITHRKGGLDWLYKPRW